MENRASAIFPARPLLLYDAECGLCDALVRWLLRRVEARGQTLSFAALQGRTAARFLHAAGLVRAGEKAGAFESLVFVPAWKENACTRTDLAVFLRTDAVICALKRLGGGWGAVAWFAEIIPPGARDWVYRQVARRRRRIFGKVKAGAGIAAQEWARATGRFLP